MQFFWMQQRCAAQEDFFFLHHLNREIIWNSSVSLDMRSSKLYCVLSASVRNGRNDKCVCHIWLIDWLFWSPDNFFSVFFHFFLHEKFDWLICEFHFVRLQLLSIVRYEVLQTLMCFSVRTAGASVMPIWVEQSISQKKKKTCKIIHKKECVCTRFTKKLGAQPFHKIKTKTVAKKNWKKKKRAKVFQCFKRTKKKSKT